MKKEIPGKEDLFIKGNIYLNKITLYWKQQY